MNWRDSVKDTTRVIIIHPNYPEQHLALWDFVDNKAATYVRFEGQALSEERLRQQTQSVYDALSSAVRPDYVVLDECDRVEEAAFISLLQDLLQRVDSVRIVVLSRVFPNLLLEEQALRDVMQLLPADETAMLPDYTRKVRKPRLEVHAFGRGRIFIDGREITEWGGELTRQLIFFIVDNPIIRRDFIFDTFWPDMNSQAATNVFHVTKRNVRKVLGLELMQHSGGMYRLTDKVTLNYDVTTFYDMAQQGVLLVDEALLAKSVQFFHGEFLQGSDRGWIQGRRQELSLMYADSLTLLATIKAQNGTPDEVLGLLLRASAAHMEREDIAEQIMRLYLDKDMPCDALTVYERTHAYIKDTLSVPSNDILTELAALARQRCDEQTKT